jgi:hypothetical protein
VATKKTQKIRVKLIGKDAGTAYIYLPGFPNKSTAGCVARNITLDSLMRDYSGMPGYKAGPHVHFDFNEDNLLIGIEILVFGD